MHYYETENTRSGYLNKLLSLLSMYLCYRGLVLFHERVWMMNRPNLHSRKNGIKIRDIINHFILLYNDEIYFAFWIVFGLQACFQT
jgi:hypothetical protein